MMAEPPPTEVVGQHLSLVLRWWAVIVGMVSLGVWTVRRGVVAPRAELSRLSGDVSDLREDMVRNAQDHEQITAQLDRMATRLDRMHDLILRLHVAHGLEGEETR